MARENTIYANPYAALIRAGIAHRRGDVDSAATLLEKALKEFETADMTLYAVVARHRLGEMIGGDRGSELREEANEWMSRQLIKNPAKDNEFDGPWIFVRRPNRILCASVKQIRNFLFF
jgi:hypothetical protein